MSLRSPIVVCGLTAGDYLLWNWSLAGNHAVLAIVSGLTLPPLAIVALWLCALTLARLLARVSGRSRGQATPATARPASADVLLATVERPPDRVAASNDYPQETDKLAA